MKQDDYVLFKHKAQAWGLKKAIQYAIADPDENLEKLMSLIPKLDENKAMKSHYDGFFKAVKDKEGNWYKFLLKILKEANPKQRDKFIENVIINATLFGRNKTTALSEKHDCNIPWAILMDPTSACNLICTGCWAADYGNRLNLSLEELDDIIRQGKELGIYAYIYSGGEPLVRKRDIMTLCRKHQDCYFLAFTNGTLIDEAFADDMLEVGNFMPAISVEGFEDDTDFR